MGRPRGGKKVTAAFTCEGFVGPLSTKKTVFCGRFGVPTLRYLRGEWRQLKAVQNRKWEAAAGPRGKNTKGENKRGQRKRKEGGGGGQLPGRE